jgi:flagellar L-ring protein precursor FlgH
MKNVMKCSALLIVGLSGCMFNQEPRHSLNIPSEDYAQAVRARFGDNRPITAELHRAALIDGRAAVAEPTAHLVGSEGVQEDLPSSVRVVPAYKDGLIRDYNGPLSLGDPGVTASLWRESRGGINDIFRDNRAYQPMDIITVTITERSEGRKEARTEVIQKSDVMASIAAFFGLEKQLQAANDNGSGTGANRISFAPNPDGLVEASTQNNFRGEGRTERRDNLTGRISAVVMEVLPSGVMRIEGQRIITVSGEEQTMVLSGLVRIMDINSINEIDSSKIAQLRIDYFGRGTIGEAQHGGWGARLMRKLWPF